MNHLTTFDFESHAVRSVTIDDEPWFVGKDICRCLEIGNHNDALSRLDDDERMDGVGITDPIGREQNATCISEPGIYRLVFTSRKEEAERFKRWLAHKVLPAIRKTGRYESEATPPELNEHNLDEVLKAWSAVNHCRRLMGSKAARSYMTRFAELPRREELLSDEGNPLARFIKDSLEPDNSGRLQSGEFYQLYLEWCETGGAEPISQTSFGRQLSRLGIEKQASNGRVFRLGWKVKL